MINNAHLISGQTKSADESATITTTTKKMPHCIACRSDRVMRGAWACWNIDTQNWELQEVFELTLCYACECECKVNWKTANLRSRTEKIRTLNNDLRHGNPGTVKVVMTQGVQTLGEKAIAELIRAVAGFDNFHPDNDPYGEHDFGSFIIRGNRLFIKIDYYNQAMDGLSFDPADPEVTMRVITIMLASEY